MDNFVFLVVLLRVFRLFLNFLLLNFRFVPIKDRSNPPPVVKDDLF